MAAGQIHDSTTAVTPPHPPCHYPGFVQFLAWQTAGAAYCPCDGVEQGITGELWKQIYRKSVAG